MSGYILPTYNYCNLCGGLTDDGGCSILIENKTDRYRFLWYCLDCLEDRYSEVCKHDIEYCTKNDCRLYSSRQEVKNGSGSN